MVHYLLNKLRNQFLPINEEVENWFVGTKVLFTGQKFAKGNVYSYVIKNNLYIPLEVVPKEMVRTKINLDNNLSKLKVSRDITIFTHASYWDLIACILSIFNEKNRNLFPRNSSLNNKKFY